jgi:hypothetical protein
MLFSGSTILGDVMYFLNLFFSKHFSKFVKTFFFLVSGYVRLGVSLGSFEQEHLHLERTSTAAFARRG